MCELGSVAFPSPRKFRDYTDLVSYVTHDCKMVKLNLSQVFYRFNIKEYETVDNMFDFQCFSCDTHRKIVLSMCYQF